MMNNRWLLESGVIFLVLWMIGCSGSRQSAGIYEDELPNTVLWKIESDKLSAPSYLLGTIHLIPADKYYWPEHFDQAYDKARQVILEIDELGMDPGSMMRIMPRLMLPDNQSLVDIVSDSEYTIIEEYFAEMGLPVMLFNNVKPFFLYMLVEMDMGSLMMENVKSYEMEITTMSRQDDKPILGLETLDFQLSLFDSISYEDQAGLLIQAIEESSRQTEEGLPSNNEKLFETYVAQDLNAILEEVKNTDPGMAHFTRMFLDNRNKAWIPRIEEFVQQKPSFIAVGAAHLPGRNGVIHLLQEAGYTLTPILNSGDGID